MTNQDNRSKDGVDPSACSGQDLRQKAEALARERAARTPENSAALSPEVIRETLHELRVHQIELEMQNEELRTAQAQIEAGRARYFDLYDLAPVGYCTLSEEGTILEANLTVATLLGSARAALTKLPITRFILEEDQDIYYLHHKQLLETGEAQVCELRLVQPDGAVCWAHLMATAAKAEDGMPFCRVVLSDITKRMQADEALGELQRFFQSTLDGLSAHIAVIDDRGEILFTNRAYRDFAERNGIEPSAVSEGANYLEVCDAAQGEDRNEATLFARGIRDVLSGKCSSFELEYPCHSPDEQRWFVGRVTPIEDKGRQRVVVAHENITDRKLADEALWQSREILRAVLDNIPARVFWKDRNLNYLGCNVPFARDAGLQDPQQLIGKDDFAMGWREQAERYRRDDLEVIETGSPRLLVEEPQTTPSGETIHLLTSKVALRDVHGFVIGVLGTYVDVSELKQAEEERANLQAQLHQAQKMESVGRLAGGVAHDFNNLLTIIIGHADMILRQMSPGQQFHANLTEIKKAGVRSADLTRQLLAFARKQTVAPRVIDLNETVEGMLKMLLRLIGEDIDLVWRPGNEVWPVMMDPGQIDQILANLCVNARDAIAGVGKMTIETNNTEFDEAYCKCHTGYVCGAYVMLAVSDNGCGMNSETLSHLFEPFFTTKESGKGTGLGLATVYGVVKQNNGFINVYSEPGQGTIFRIYVPRHLAKTVQLPEIRPDKPGKRGHETVLLVEDESAILELATTMLEQEGYTVVPADTPGKAIRLANEHAGAIHLLMTDVVMPEMNGRDLAKNILSLYPSLKCLFMSGYTADVIAHHGVLDKGVNFIQKPFSKGDLAVKVREVLDRD